MGISTSAETRLVRHFRQAPPFNKRLRITRLLKGEFATRPPTLLIWIARKKQASFLLCLRDATRKGKRGNQVLSRTRPVTVASDEGAKSCFVTYLDERGVKRRYEIVGGEGVAMQRTDRKFRNGGHRLHVQHGRDAR